MEKKEAIKYLQQLYYNGGHFWLDEQRIEAVGMAIKALQDEPVSEDFEEVVKKLWNEINSVHEYSVIESYNVFYGLCLDIANWQKEQFEKERLKHCNELTKEQAQIESDFVVNHLKKHNRTPTFIYAIEYGMKLQEKQMMKGAIDVKINRDTLYDLKPFIHEKYLDYKIGDKCKMILIKEE